MPLKNYESLKLRKSSQDGCAQWAVEEQKMAEVAKRGCNGGDRGAVSRRFFNHTKRGSAQMVRS